MERRIRARLSPEQVDREKYLMSTFNVKTHAALYKKLLQLKI